jgi:hypothetical protein
MMIIHALPLVILLDISELLCLTKRTLFRNIKELKLICRIPVMWYSMSSWELFIWSRNDAPPHHLIHSTIRTKSTLDLTLSQLNPFGMFMTYFSMIRFNNILPSGPRYSRRTLCFRFLNQIFVVVFLPSDFACRFGVTFYLLFISYTL